MDMEIQAEKFECIFRDEILSKIAGALTYTEKLVLSLYNRKVMLTFLLYKKMHRKFIK